MSDIVDRLNRAGDLAIPGEPCGIYYDAANEITRLRLTDEERASMTRAIETLEGVEYMEAFCTENDATAAAILRGLLERLGGVR